MRRRLSRMQIKKDETVGVDIQWKVRQYLVRLRLFYLFHNLLSSRLINLKQGGRLPPQRNFW
ncbi:MAG: hypothetical protein Q7I93_05400 [Syntrophales bacterium]|nr:hypothetical protein [Syntrophales bacterium]